MTEENNKPPKNLLVSLSIILFQKGTKLHTHYTSPSIHLLQIHLVGGHRVRRAKISECRKRNSFCRVLSGVKGTTKTKAVVVFSLFLTVFVRRLAFFFEITKPATMPDSNDLIRCLGDLREGEATVFGEQTFILCGKKTQHSLFFMKEPFILASACCLETKIPDVFRSVICTSALLNKTTTHLVQSFPENDIKRNELFKSLPMRLVGLQLPLPNRG